MEVAQKKRIKIVIIVLSVLISLNAIALGCILLYDRFADPEPTSVVIPDNIITPNGVESDTASQEAEASITPGFDDLSLSGDQRTALSVILDKRSASESIPFSVKNMMPGDTTTQYFRISVTHKSTVTVSYHSEIDPGGEKLGEMLHSRIVLLTTGETLYDGLMRDMPRDLSHVLPTDGYTVDELYYQVTAYLSTDVGNEYAYKNLSADFTWHVDEVESLDINVKTGENVKIVLWVSLAACSLLLIFVLLFKRRGEKAYDE